MAGTWHSQVFYDEAGTVTDTSDPRGLSITSIVSHLKIMTFVFTMMKFVLKVMTFVLKVMVLYYS